MNNHWYTEVAKVLPRLSYAQHGPWLDGPYRLAQAMRRVSVQLQPHVLFQGINSYLVDEAAMLNDQDETACYTREALMKDGSHLLWFARTVMPLSTYRRYQQQFDHLDGKLLGDTLLYPQDTLRGPFEFAALDAAHCYHHKTTCLNLLTVGARRSVFYLEKKYPLLINEVFLPETPQFIPELVNDSEARVV